MARAARGIATGYHAMLRAAMANDNDRSLMNYDYWRYAIRGWLFHFIGRNAPAYAAYESAIRHNPDSMPAARALAYIAAEDRRLGDAQQWYRVTLRIAPDDAGSWFNLGYVLGEDGKHAEAVAAFQKAVALQPQLDRAWYGLGLSHTVLGQHAMAVEAYAEAVRLQPMNGIAWYQLGMAHHRAGQPEALEKAIRRLADFDPKTCRELMRDAGREDLLPLIADRLL